MRGSSVLGMPAVLLAAVMVLAWSPPSTVPAVSAAGPYDCQGRTYRVLAGPEAVRNGGFEAGLTDWDIASYPMTLSTTVVHSGTYAAKADAVDYMSTNRAQPVPPLPSAYALTHWFYVESWGPGGLWGVATIRNWDPSTGAGDDAVTVLVERTSIRWQSWLIHGVSGVEQTVPSVLTTGAWHSLTVVADATRGVQCLYVDDALLSTATVDPGDTFLPEHIVFGDLSWAGDAGVAYYDDLSILPAEAQSGNEPPVASAGGPYAGGEASPITFDASASTDPDGDALTFRWDFQDDGAWDTDWSSSPYANFTWGDDWAGEARVEVSDGSLTANATADVTVRDVAPTIREVRADVLGNLTLRVAGEKWHDVNLPIYRDGVAVGNASVTRFPGSPDDQAATIENVTIDLLGGNLSAVVTYTPEDDPVNGQPNGATPAWLILTARDGSTSRLHHTFNVRHNESWVWRVEDLRAILAGVNVTFSATATDPGSDDLTFAWDFGDGFAATKTVYNNGVSPDPYPSPDVHPITARDAPTHLFTAAGTYVVTLTVTDDDGLATDRTVVLAVG